MKIISWNMAHRARAWNYLDAADFDIALLQEVVPPAHAPDPTRWVFKPLPGLNWGTAILSRSAPLIDQPITIPDAWLPSVRIAAATSPDPTLRDITLASVHAGHSPLDPMVISEDDFNAARVAEAATPWDCDLAYNALRAHLGDRERFIAAGDWNTGRLFDETWGTAKGLGRAFFDRAENHGWIDCHFRTHGKEARTWFRGNDAHYQLDHIFIGSPLADRLQVCFVDPTPAEAGLSDHAPLITTFKE